MKQFYRTIIFSALLLLAACNTQRLSQNRNDNETLEVSLPEVTVKPTNKIDRIRDYRASAKRDWDLLHTKLYVQFDFAKQHLNGKAWLTLVPYYSDKNALVLDAKGMDLVQVKSYDQGIWHTLAYSYDGNKLKVLLPRVYTRSDSLKLFIEYVSKPNERILTQGLAINDDKGLYFIDPLGTDSTRPTQVWTQGEVQANSVWFPTIDEPNEKCSQEIYIVCPDSFVSLSNGLLLSSTSNGDGTRTDYWRQDLPHAPYLFMMAIGDFSVTTDRWKDKPVSYYVEPKYGPYAKEIFGKTPEMMSFFSDLLDYPYPWDKYAQISVRDYVSGAMENTSASLFFSSIQRNHRELLDRDYEDIIAHELAHHWFGDLITTESWSNVALNESFATYCEYLWEEYHQGRAEADYSLYQNLQLYLQEAQEKQEDLVRFYYEKPDDLFDRHSYEKGSCVMHMLRKYLGDDKFFDGVRLYVKRHAFKAAEMHELRLAMEEVSGEDLNWFFNQWFYENGHPVLNIDYNYSSDTTSIIVAQKHSAEGELIYKIPSSLLLCFPNGKKEIHEIELNQRINIFRFYTPIEPVFVDFDPERLILCERIDNKTIPFTAQQYFLSISALSQLQAVRFFADNQTSPLADSVLANAILHPFYVIRKSVVDNIDLNKPQNFKYRQRFAEMAISDSSIAVRGSCIKALGQIEDLEPYRAMIEKAVGDSSYRISGLALSALASIDSARSMQLAIANMQDENNEISDAVAAVFSKNGDRSYIRFFESKLNSSVDFGRYTMLFHYGNFLGRMEWEEVKIGVPSLRKYALDFGSHWLAAAGNGAIKRVRSAFEARKIMASSKIKSAEPYDLASLHALEEEIKRCDQIILYTNEVLKEIAEKKAELMKN